MDISATTEPRSDQQNFDDYAAGPRTVTISEVRAGSAEQPVELHLAEYPGRPYKPSKSMRRVLVAAWGSEAEVYVGRRMTLVGDPTVKFGGSVVGGIKIAALSNLDKRLTISLTVTKGKRAPHTVDPLPDAPPPPANPAAPLLAQIKTAAERAGVDLATVAAEWAETHGGQAIGEATDLGGLELLADDLRGRAS
jgi:hypothetical protein